MCSGKPSFFNLFGLYPKNQKVMTETNVSSTPATLLTSQQVEDLVHDTIEPKLNWFHRWFPFFKWSPSSPEDLKKAEEDFLSYVKTKSEGKYIEVNLDENTKCRIWTRIYNSTAENNVPLVMIHGMGSGMALFAMNLDELSKSRTVYTIDLPGFARSSRCQFSSKPEVAEKQYVEALEHWRQKIGLEKFCLLGHSFGGYLSSAYALTHPKPVSHLILADPWGFKEKPTEFSRPIPMVWKILYTVILKHLNPLAGLRIAGPWGLTTITRFRPDLIHKFSTLFDNDEEEMARIVPAYIYHCNAHHPSGEAAFYSMSKDFAWAKNPMLPRLAQLNSQIPLTALYGADSWITTVEKEEFETVRPNGLLTRVQQVPDAGHHVYANAVSFNKNVSGACEYSDSLHAE